MARSSWAQAGPNDTVNIGVVGFRNRGRDHYRTFAKIPGVRVAYLCDVDERLFAPAVAEVEQIAGYRPKTEFDVRKLLENKDLDAISIAAPDHWHALMTIWGCQAGKDVYVEKPCSYRLWEGRKEVEAARKYNRIVQVGLNRRSETAQPRGRRVRARRLVRHRLPRPRRRLPRPPQHRPHAGGLDSARRPLGPLPRPGPLSRLSA